MRRAMAFLFLPLLVALPAGRSLGPAWAQAGSDPDPFDGDARLERQRDVRAEGISLRDLLANLSRETGVRFTADRTVAEDKVLLYAHGRPLSATLRILARFFRFDWRRDGAGPQPTYVLYQSLTAQREEERERLARFYAAVDQVQRDLETLRSLVRLPLEDVAARKSAERAPQPQREAASAILFNPGLPALLRLLEGVDRDRLVQILADEGTWEWEWPAGPGREVLPAELVESIQARSRDLRALLPDGDLAGDAGERAFSRIVVQLQSLPGPMPRLRAAVSLTRKAAGATSSSWHHLTLPFGPTRAAGAEEPVAPKGWEQDERLCVEVSCRVANPPNDPSPLEEEADLPLPAPAAMLASLQESRPVDVISDAFWSVPRAGVNEKGRPLGEVLTAICRVTGKRWRLLDGFVALRSREYAADRWREPPASGMARWVRQVRHSDFPLDAYAEIAALRYGQMETAVSVLSRLGSPGADTAIQGRGHLALWHTLTPAQRQAARSRGIAFTALTGPQQRLFLAASTGRLDPAGHALPGVSTSGEWTPESLQGAALRVEMHEQSMWGLRTGPSGKMTTAASREEAVRNLLHGKPGYTADQVRAVVSRRVSFVYGPPNRPVCRFVVPLGEKWEKRPASGGK